MLFLLDTTAISDLMREQPTVAGHLQATTVSDRIITSVITRGEILYGIERLPVGRRQRDLHAKASALFAVIPCESVPASAAEQYAKAKTNQQRRGLSLDENDLWITATALALGCTLVTRDTDFAKIENLLVADWTQ
jgi:predicted nucleic acid-binding protein